MALNTLGGLFGAPLPLRGSPGHSMTSGLPTHPMAGSIASAIKPLASQSLGNVIAHRAAAQIGGGAQNNGTKSFTAAAQRTDTGVDPFITSPTISLPGYDGVQHNQGRATYTGLKPKPIVIKITNPSATAGETFKLFDIAGLSGIINGADIVIALTSTNLVTGGAKNTTGGYTAMNTLYGKKPPYFNRIRMSVDSKAQLDYEYSVEYFDENSRLTDNLTFIPSSAIVQEDEQSTIAEMGLEFMVTPNCVFTGSLDGNADAGYNSMTMYTLGYVWDTKSV